MTKKQTIAAIFGTLTLVVVIIMMFVLSGRMSDRSLKKDIPAGDKSMYQLLIEKNQQFSIGDGFLKGKNGPEAVKAFSEALKTAENTDQKTLIISKIADSYTASDDFRNAIDKYDEIVNMPNAEPRAKAYALISMAQLFNTFSSNDVTEYIFSKPAYKEMYVEKNPSLAYRKLNELSVSIKSTPLGELRVAQWYARDLFAHYKKYSEKDIQERVIKIKRMVSNADAQLPQFRKDPNLGGMLVLTLIAKGEVLGILSNLGYAHDLNPEDSFKEAQKYAALSPNSDSSLRFNYALYLANTDPVGRAADIKSLLSGFYTSTSYDKTPIVRSFQHENAVVLGKVFLDGMVLLTSIDPEFEKYLETTKGWKRAP